MIKSIKINGYKVHPGDVTIDGSDLIHIDHEDNTVTVKSKDLSSVSDKYNEFIDYLESVPNFPLVTSVSHIPGNTYNNLWILGDKTSQIDIADNGAGFTLCDMSQTVDYPRIYKSVYAMLRQIRLWLDAHKDTLLLKQSEASLEWDNMKNDEGDWDVDQDSPDTRPMFKEDRLREDIAALGPALNLLNEYRGTVALWNYSASLPKSSVSVRLHPADSSGLYIGANIVVPMTDEKDTTIRVEFSIQLTGQSGDNMYIWLRSPVVRSIPESRSPVITFPEGAKQAVSEEASILDEGKQIEYNGEPLTVTASMSIPKKDMRTSYIVQVVLEAIPFFLCSEKEKTYADSKKADHFTDLGENTWDIVTTVYKDDVEVQRIAETKNTAYTSVCTDPEASDSLIQGEVTT